MQLDEAFFSPLAKKIFGTLVARAAQSNTLCVLRYLFFLFFFTFSLSLKNFFSLLDLTCHSYFQDESNLQKKKRSTEHNSPKLSSSNNFATKERKNKRQKEET